MAHDNDLYLGTFDDGQHAWLSTADRRRHMYVIGRSGAGKSTLLKNIMLDDLDNHRPFSLIDPHGDLALEIAASVPSHRTNDVILADLSNKDHHIGLNPLHAVKPHDRPRVAAHILASFAHAWQLNVEVNARLLNVLNAGLRLLLDTPGSTLVGLQRLLYDSTYRTKLIAKCADPIIQHFWLDEVGRFTERYEVEAFAPLQSRLTLLLSDPAVRHIVGQVKSTIDIARVMDEGKVLLLRIPRGKLGDVPTYLLGAMFAAAFAHAAEARADQAEHDRRDHCLAIDEFQLAASTSNLADIISGGRKYRLGLLLAHQMLSQLPDQLRKSIPGSAGSLIVFEVSAEDAMTLAPELSTFDPLLEHSGLQTANRGVFDPAALTNMQPHTAWVRLMQNSHRTERRLLFPAYFDAQSRRRLERVRRASIATYMRPRHQIERKLAEFLGPRPA